MNTTTKAMKILGESVENDIEEIQEAKEYSIGKVKLAVYDNGGETADRYTIVPKGEGYKERNGMVEMIGASENPTSPTGVYQHSEGQVGKHLGKRIDFEKLPEALQKALKDEFKEEIAEGKDEKVTMNNLDWGKTTEERNKNLEKYNSLKTDTEKENFRKELKGITEACSGKKEDIVKEGKAETSELKIFIDNDGDLYRQQKVPMYKNLTKKMIKGTYDKELAKKLMMYLVEAGAKKYAKEAGPNAVWHEMFSMADRKQVASELVDDFEDAFKSKEYDFMKEEKEVVKEGVNKKSAMYQDGYDNATIAFGYIPDFKDAQEKLDFEGGLKDGYAYLKNKNNVVKEEVVEEGIGFELYSKGADRIQTQTVQINEFAKKLADLARENAPLTKKKKALKELKKWVDVVNGELKQLDSDVDNLEGYKEEVVSEADNKKTKLDFLRSRLASESGEDKKETEKEIEELEKEELEEKKDYTIDEKQPKLNPNRISVKVTFDNGAEIRTPINLDLEGAKKYYLGKTFNIDAGEEDIMAKAVKVELIK